MPHPKSRPARFISILALTALLAGCAQQPAPTGEAAITVPPPGKRVHYQVFFKTDSAALDEEGRSVIASIASVAASDKNMSVRVIGKTDRLGAPPVNMALSKRRTEVVLEALVAAGMPTARIDWGWTGERGAPIPTADEKSEPRNRVVDITVNKEAN